MALFDEDNPGKNLTNATLWLESSDDSHEYESPGGVDGFIDSGCLSVALMIAAFIVVPVFVFSCAVNMA